MTLSSSGSSSGSVSLPDPYLVRRFDRPIDATVLIPGSKSITNRALVCAALAQGVTVLRGALVADDTEAMVDCLQRVGSTIVSVDGDATTLSVTGLDGRLLPGPVTLDARLSGTTSRFVAPLCSLGTGDYTLDSAGPMRARPMGDLVTALRKVGLSVSTETDDRMPLVIHATGHETTLVRAVRRAVSVPGNASSQFLSGLLLSAPCWAGGAEIVVTGELVSRPYVDMTVAVMRSFGAVVTEPRTGRFLVEGTGYQSPGTFAIEPDASAASYFLAAAAITGGRVRIDGLGSSSLQGDVRFASILEEMGCALSLGSDFVEIVAPSGGLRGVSVNMADCSDTAQTLAAVAVFATGVTTVTGIDFIRRKETDRIAAVVAELARCGVVASEDADGFTIVPGAVLPAVVQTYRDHRMAMSFSLLGMCADGIEIADPACVDKTFPTFFDVLESLR
jgi:3-phosphoshikimate 1-carboxyvinyltransferase